MSADTIPHGMTPGHDGKPCMYCEDIYCDTYCAEPNLRLCCGCNRIMPSDARGLRVYLDSLGGYQTACKLSCALDAAKRTPQTGREAA